MAEHVNLAYALTIHKAQGVTVDQSILIADAALSAEALYVGMTRGRHDNTALVITDPIDLDRHHQPEPLEPAVVLTNALNRPTAERAAIDEIRHAFERSESLATLEPRLANLDTWLRDNTPVDHSIDLERARCHLTDVERGARPGRLTRRGRTDRQQELDAHENARAAWHDQHTDTFTYRDQLAEQIKTRTLDLGRAAAIDQPDHLARMLGPYPDQHPARDRWIFAAARIEAYREEWGVAASDLHHAPADNLQHKQWRTIIDIPHRLEALSRPPANRVRDVHDIGIERGFGIDL